MNAWRPFIVALVLPVLFSGFALLHAWVNRSASRDAISLSEREVTLSGASDENSAVTAWLSWSDERSRGRWLSRQQLESLGFDLPSPPESTQAYRGYRRQLERRAYIALELRDDGDRWRSRLVPVDAGRDRDSMLRKYPAGGRYLVTRGTIGIRLVEGRESPVFVDGYIVSLDPRGIHVPSAYRDRVLAGSRKGRFTLQVQYGSRLEPQVVGAW